MYIRQKLNEVQANLSDEQEEERNIVNDLIFLMFGRDFEIECIMDNEKVETFLKEELKLNVKSVNLVPMSFMMEGQGL